MSTSQAPTCVLVRGGEADQRGKQATYIFPAITAQSTGARGLCMELITIPPGGRAKAHMHESHETAIYVLSGEVESFYGEGLRERMVARAGDFIYVPAGVPHLPVNLSQTEPARAVVARTDPNEQESVVLLPELDNVH